MKTKRLFHLAAASGITGQSILVMALLLVGLAASSIPATAEIIEVSTTLDEIGDDGQCSLREAVIASNTDTASGVMEGECPAGLGTDTIILSAATYNLTRGGGGEDASLVGDLDILDSVEIQGAGLESTVIYGNDIDRVFHIRNVPEVDTVTISNLTVSHGTVSGNGGGILNRKTLVLDSVWIFESTAGDDGGGIYTSGNLQMTSSLVSLNVSADDGAGIFITPTSQTTIEDSRIFEQVGGGTGAGVYNDGSLTLSRTTLDTNQSVWGAAVHSLRDLTIRESTLHHNTATRFGGGLANEGTALVINSTISGNDATEYAGNVVNLTGGILNLVYSTIADGVAPIGTAVHNDATVTTTSTIFRGDCNGTGLTSSGGNVESPGHTCNLTAFRDRKNQTAEQLDMLDLGDYGGPTLTHLVGRNSVAIDRGRAADCPANDQRGETRPIDGNDDGRAFCDTGSYEYSTTFFADGFETGDTSRWTVAIPE